MDNGFLGVVAIQLQRLGELAFLADVIDEAEYKRSQDDAHDLMDYALETSGMPNMTDDIYKSLVWSVRRVLRLYEAGLDDGLVSPHYVSEALDRVEPGSDYLDSLKEFYGGGERYSDTED